MTEVTLRDEFAVAAVPALIALAFEPQKVGEWAYAIADAMLAARQGPPDPLGRDERGVSAGMRDYLASQTTTSRRRRRG